MGEGKAKKSLGAGLIGLVWGPQGEGHDQDVTPEAPPLEPLPPGATAKPETLVRLREAVGLNDPASLLRSFTIILGKLESAIPDEKARYKAAMDVAVGTQAVTLDGVLGDFKEHIQKLQAESSRFAQTLKDMTAKKVDTKRSALGDIQAAVDAKRAELAELEANATKLKAAIQTEEAAILAEGQDFQAAYEMLMGELRAGEAKLRDRLGVKD